jgi:putative zinc finger protein
MSMNCLGVKSNSTAYLDGKLRPSEVVRLRAHVAECRPCASMLEELYSIRSGMLLLEKPKLPALLSTRLRVLASRERSALIQSGVSRWTRLRLRWQARVDELMRPLTIPATGGLLSSLALFATLGFSIRQGTPGVTYEVPVAFEDTITANLVPMDMRSSVVLTMSLDDKGRIQDYAVSGGTHSYSADGSRLSASNIVFPQFPTVLAVARPITGDVRISLTPVLFRQ